MLDSLVALVLRVSGRVSPKTSAESESLYWRARAEAETRRAVVSSTSHAAAPARTIGRWGPHGPRWAAKSAEMAHFAVSGRPKCEIWALCAVSYLVLGKLSNDMKNCAISATLSIQAVHLVVYDL